MAAPTIVASTALIELQHVTKVYGKKAAVHALKGIDFRVRRGDFVAVMGHSGSGKSTCMNILGCLDTPSEGIYRFEGVDVGALSRDQRALLRRRYIGFVFQGFNLLQPHFSPGKCGVAPGLPRHAETAAQRESL